MLPGNYCSPPSSPFPNTNCTRMMAKPLQHDEPVLYHQSINTLGLESGPYLDVVGVDHSRWYRPVTLMVGAPPGPLPTPPHILDAPMCSGADFLWFHAFPSRKKEDRLFCCAAAGSLGREEAVHMVTARYRKIRNPGDVLYQLLHPVSESDT